MVVGLPGLYTYINRNILVYEYFFRLRLWKYAYMHIFVYAYHSASSICMYTYIYIYPISSKQVQVSTTTVYIYMYIIGISVIIVITMGNILIGTTNILNYIDTYKKIMNWWIDLRRVFRLFKNHRKCTCLRFLQHKSHQVCYFIPGSSGRTQVWK